MIDFNDASLNSNLLIFFNSEFFRISNDLSCAQYSNA